MAFFGRRHNYPEYKHKVHYAMGPKEALCSVWKTCGRKKPLMTKVKSEVTCVTCQKKLGKGLYIVEHFEGDLFTV